MNLLAQFDTIRNMMLDNACMSIYPELAMCYYCGYAPIRKVKVSQYAPRQCYHCPACKRSYWVPVSRKEE